MTEIETHYYTYKDSRLYWWLGCCRTSNELDSPIGKLLHVFYGRIGTSSSWRFISYLWQCRRSDVCRGRFPPHEAVGLICTTRGFGKSTAIESFRVAMMGKRRVDIIKIPDDTTPNAPAVVAKHLQDSLASMDSSYPSLDIVFIDELDQTNMPSLAAMTAILGQYKQVHFVVVSSDLGLIQHVKNTHETIWYVHLCGGANENSHSYTMKGWTFKQLKSVCLFVKPHATSQLSNSQLVQAGIVSGVLPGQALNMVMLAATQDTGPTASFYNISSSPDETLLEGTSLTAWVREKWTNLTSFVGEMWNGMGR